MVATIYVEEGLRGSARAERVLQCFPQAEVVGCEHYSEVFNPAAQSFRLQKARPALILARKRGKLIHPTPPGYGLGGVRNYYFSHMLNCVYDCRYCFLQGMFRSASYVLFLNYEDFGAAIRERQEADPDEPSFFFSGYDCDSLAFDAVSDFARWALDLFRELPRATLELRTKSVRVEPLLERPPLANCVVAFSLSPPEIASAHEHGTPSVERRLQAMRRLADAGWRLGVRFDPLIAEGDFQQRYRDLFAKVFEVVPVAALHSVSLGAFRLPRGFHRRMTALYPEEPLLAAGLAQRDGMVTYEEPLLADLVAGCEESLLRHVPRSLYFPCLS